MSIADLVEICQRHATLSWCPRFEVALLENQRMPARASQLLSHKEKKPAAKRGYNENDYLL